MIDAYNANPSSMRAALDNFAATEFPGKVLMLGDMLELGPDSADEHMAILRHAVSVSGEIYLVGNEFTAAAAALGAGYARILPFPTIEDLKAYVTEHPLEERTILIKGSNGKHMERVVDAL